ncbi:MAG: cytochrome d ubiquinol oxidase subunit II [Bacteroidota bacterium]|nr:cytochrome d ubiquinol oxidase subunit II [Bacteroidota bacterium]
MFEQLSLFGLQQYWWMIISLLGSILVFLMFVQGGQTLIFVLGKTEMERKILVNILGRKWEFTFTTLVTFGGAFFASFPLFYSTSFGGAYWLWMIILFCFIFQAVSYEFRTKPGNLLGQRVYEIFLILNGILGTFLLGIAVATFFTGSLFSINKMNLSDLAAPVISRWESPAHGMEAVLNWKNILLGLAVFFLSRVLGLLYFLNTVGDDNILLRVKKQLWINALLFLLFFLSFIVTLFLSRGFALNPSSGVIFIEQYKYLHNLLAMPGVFILLALGVVAVLTGILFPFIEQSKISGKGIWFAGPGTILTVFSLFLLAGFNNTAFYPSTYDIQSSLTIRNSSSSRYTLTVMSYVSLLVPIVIVYIWYAWRSMNKVRTDAKEMEEEHLY